MSGIVGQGETQRDQSVRAMVENWYVRLRGLAVLDILNTGSIFRSQRQLLGATGISSTTVGCAKYQSCWEVIQWFALDVRQIDARIFYQR